MERTKTNRRRKLYPGKKFALQLFHHLPFRFHEVETRQDVAQGRIEQFEVRRKRAMDELENVHRERLELDNVLRTRRMATNRTNKFILL